MLKQLFSSKKFVVSLVGVIVAVVAHYSPNLAPVIENILNLVMVYVVGQGLADLGKEKKK